MSIVNYPAFGSSLRTDNTFPCSMPDCDAIVSDGARCYEHGGNPKWQYREDYWGHVTYQHGNPKGETNADRI